MGVRTAVGKGSKEIGRLLKTSECEYLLSAWSPQLGGEKCTWGKDGGREGYGVAGSSPVWGEETPLPPGSVAWIPSGAGLLLASLASARRSRFTTMSLLSAWDSLWMLHSQLVKILVWG